MNQFKQLANGYFWRLGVALALGTINVALFMNPDLGRNPTLFIIPIILMFITLTWSLYVYADGLFKTFKAYKLADKEPLLLVLFTVAVVLGILTPLSLAIMIFTAAANGYSTMNLAPFYLGGALIPVQLATFIGIRLKARTKP